MLHNNQKMLQMLLYLENKMSEKEINEYSEYLKQNPSVLEKVLQISKSLVISNTDTVIHSIDIVNVAKGHIEFALNGVVNLLQQKKLAFRSSAQIVVNNFQFYDLCLQFIQKSSKNLELIISSNAESCYEWIDNKNITEYISSKKGQLFNISPSQDYILQCSDYQNNKQRLLISY